ncbi:hypothetical protein FE257_002362 [Aspergillus nanangensis]|uniref:Uncharacterized protein n=1 Tax=Aspergillus nanangensis TaxID=2582783 RepID=A0AAD4GNC2_ASPNN|nr:hypothetical protein FE257_002362 [Aspergillus nanangensis]
MSEEPSCRSSSHLEPPRESVELEDPGAQDSVASTSDEEHFSDASEGHERSRSRSPSDRTLPVPLTRVEKVDDEPSYGEVPGTEAFDKRDQDAVPDEVEVIPEGSRSRSHSVAGQRSPGSPVPRTMVEKVDMDQASYGDIPGTPGYENRRADAVPDVVIAASNSNTPQILPNTGPQDLESTEENISEIDVPETVLSRVDSLPTDHSDTIPRAHKIHPGDALPDVTETVPDIPDPTAFPSHTSQNSSTVDVTTGIQEAHDDFDDFAAEQDMGEDDFGDFDDGFQEPSADVSEDEPMTQSHISTPRHPTPPIVPSLMDLESVQSLPDLLAALDESLNLVFPATKEISSLPPTEPIQNSSAIFNTERSLSLWSQLVAPPPLQPQNWVKSRIRRLFLVSLGVPVDLDEILPASKQKKLVLPSINLGGSENGSSTTHSRSQSQIRKDGNQSGPNSPRTSGTATRHRSSRRREQSLPPDLDLSAVRRLCATTDAALNGLTDTELQGHVQELEQVTLRASSVLEYWLKRRDGLVSEKEAFEGVIENLVNHARRVRK